MNIQKFATLHDVSFARNPKQIPTLMIVGPVEDDIGRGSPFTPLPWRISRVPNCLDFLIQGTRTHPRVVVCERDLPDGSWKDVLDLTLALCNRPPVIVTSRLADECLWAEVLNLGGYDVLAKPLDEREVYRAVQLAWEHSANQSAYLRTTGRPMLARSKQGYV
jgi:DNA-binding response OmpR family regulator